MVLCLEDSMPDDEVPRGRGKCDRRAGGAAAPDDPDELPLLFIRCRTPEQMLDVAAAPVRP